MKGVFNLPSTKNIAQYTDGYKFEFLSEKPVYGDFRCICLGRLGYKGYEIRRNDGLVIKVGQNCLKHCGLVLSKNK